MSALSSSAVSPDPYANLRLNDAREETRFISIRSLAQQSPDNDRVECEMKVFDLCDTPQFTALSYVWGPPNPTHEISVNGQSVRVRANLFHFLQEFRKLAAGSDTAYAADRWLWVDQLSIDQANVRERNHQVRGMHTIYRCATSVIVWLGEGRERYPIIRGKSCTLYEAAKSFNSTSDIRALAVILRSHYFTRLWIVQEFLLARRLRILVKDQWIEESWLKHSTPYLRQPTMDLLTARKSTFGDAGYQDLRSALTRFSHNACHDPRDKIYGLLGLVRPDDRPETIDYGKSPQQVFADAMLVVLRSDPFFTLEQPGDIETMPIGRSEDLYMVALNMRFTESQLATLKVIMKSLWHPWRLPLFRGHSCPITAMGFDAAGSIPEDGDRWWFDFRGKRYYAECGHRTTMFTFRAETVRLLTERWGKYVNSPVEHNPDGATRERWALMNFVKIQLILMLGACWRWIKRLIAKLLGSYVPEHGLDSEQSPLLRSQAER